MNSISGVGWAKAAETVPGTHGLHSAVPTTASLTSFVWLRSGRVGTADQTPCLKSKIRSRLCPPYFS
jgi:hypothetical protein